MKRLITTFASAILLLSSTACVSQLTCSEEKMIAMKNSGFDQNRIESMCMSRRLDSKSVTDILSSSTKAYEAVVQAKREAKASTSKEEKEAAQLRAVVSSAKK